MSEQKLNEYTRLVHTEKLVERIHSCARLGLNPSFTAADAELLSALLRRLAPEMGS